MSSNEIIWTMAMNLQIPDLLSYCSSSDELKLFCEDPNFWRFYCKEHFFMDLDLGTKDLAKILYGFVKNLWEGNRIISTEVLGAYGNMLATGAISEISDRTVQSYPLGIAITLFDLMFLHLHSYQPSILNDVNEEYISSDYFSIQTQIDFNILTQPQIDLSTTPAQIMLDYFSSLSDAGKIEYKKLKDYICTQQVISHNMVLKLLM